MIPREAVSSNDLLLQGETMYTLPFINADSP